MADSAQAPYGERSPDFVIERTHRVASFLRKQGAHMLVIACNTATAAAVQALRSSMHDWPIVGIEPGVKPALGLTRNGQIGVMATAGTLRSAKFNALLDSMCAQAAGNIPIRFHLQACTGLAQAIEQHPLDSPVIDTCIAAHAQPLRQAGCDVVVLGCTHYPLVAEHIGRHFDPDVVFVDTSAAVARRTVQVASSLQLQLTSADSEAGRVTLWSTGDTRALQALTRRWLGLDQAVEQAQI